MISISVIIPSYNVEDYIEDSLRSALEQTYAAMEIICVDDKSDDRTVEIIRRLQVEYPQRIQLFVNDQNRGATYTRNRGLAVVKGDYVQFLDSDDILYPDKLQHQVKRIEKLRTKPDILVGSCKKTYIDGTIRSMVYKDRDPWCALMDSKLGVTTSNLFLRSKLLEINGWADGLQSSQEYELMFRMLKKKATVVFDQEILNMNREREFGSITKTNPSEMWKRYIGLRIKIYDYLIDNNLLTKERKQTCINIIFDAIRFLYKYDPNTSLAFHEQYVSALGKPSITSSTSGRYLTFYRLLGFKAAQLLARIINRPEHTAAQ